jgi:nucleotide-binding universal stress UspA family protein
MTTVDVQTHVHLSNILFATDFSPASTAALAFAAEIARRYRATLYILHVRPASMYAMSPPETWSALAEVA